MTENTIKEYEALSHLRILVNIEEERRDVIIAGELALAENRRRGYTEWIKIGQAVHELQVEVARHSNTQIPSDGRSPSGRRYSDAWADLAPPNLKTLSSALRSLTVWLWRNQEEFGRWFAPYPRIRRIGGGIP